MTSLRSKAYLYVTTACVSALIGIIPVKAADEVGEIIVTARKREESLLNVPVIETAIPQQRLETLQVLDLYDLPKIAPGLNIGKNVLTIANAITIWGVGGTSSDAGAEQSVSLNIDGLSITQGIALSSGMFDLQQIEVLKGPQSLFYGKASSGGVVSLRTADPTDKFEMIARAGYDTEAATKRGELIISGPVADGLKMRLSGMYSNSDGYFDSRGQAVAGTGAVNPGYSSAPHASAYQVRFTTLWDPSSQFSARLKVNFVHDRIHDAAVDQLAYCPQGASFNPSGIPFSNENCRLDRTYNDVWLNPASFPGAPFNGVPTTDTRQNYGTLELNYRPSDQLTVTSTTGYYLVRSAALDNALATSAAGPAIEFDNQLRRRELTQELRVNSNFSGPLNFTAGGYYEDGQLVFHEIARANLAYANPAGPYAGVIIQSPFGPFPLPVYTALFGPFFNGDGVATDDIKTYSLFGQLRYKIVPQLELAAGLRWNDEKRQESIVNYGTTGAQGQLVDGPGRTTAVANPIVASKNVSPEITLTYKPTDDMTLFGAYKQGFKSGNFTLATITSLNNGDDNSFRDEKVKGGEVGFKSRLADHQVAFNVAGYYYHYSGLQVGTVEPATNGVIAIHTVNAGGAKTYGLDADVTYKPHTIDGLTLNAAVNYNKSKYENLTNIQCWAGQTIALGCNIPLNGVNTYQNLSGTQLVRAPRWQMNFGFDYEMPVAGDYKLVFSNSNMYTSKYPRFLAVNFPGNSQFQPAFAKVDLGLALHSPQDKWELSVVGKNVTDKVIASQCSTADIQAGVIYSTAVSGTTSSPYQGQTICFAEPGRELWLRLTVRPFN